MAPVQDQPNDDISWRILVGTIVSIIPATICVILRFIARHIARASLWWDDYTIVGALTINWAMDSLRWAQVALYDYGHHAQYVSQDKLDEFGKSFTAVQVLYFTNTVFTKASLLLLFYRIFGIVRSFRWAIWVVAFLAVAYFIACSLTALVGCLPLSKAWDTREPDRCINEVTFFRANGIGNMVLDFIVLCLPFPMAWRLNTTTRQKFILSGIFLLGGFVCIVSILRIVSVKSAVIPDPTYTSLVPATWSTVEQSVGIICACLPTLRPLFRRFYGATKVASTRNNSADVVFAQNRPSISGRRSFCDEESSSMSRNPSCSTQQHNRPASIRQLNELSGGYRSPTFQ
ncbi:uncharacterized protein N7479_000862 [Penicillium vulpinum]|uniref:Rhodopsin domain-containing protein n=1 Tax=Penicillium vulpinum TaxID=29845 RepID=A0A1V6S5V8_9EURO|nr:uncharacterized protein N7479_000862 [Penicillium vulpinum]KAJ5970944.1 hypothetical protein N7479_000862 [Penicillium vulpinum]OQE09415.1 hypothetical protein PENVUL_c006G01538 [Penicillium vulpinum]